MEQPRSLTSSARINLPTRAAEILLDLKQENIRHLEESFACRVHARGNQISIKGEDGQQCRRLAGVLKEFAALVQEGVDFSGGDLRQAFSRIAEGSSSSLTDFFQKTPVLRTGVRDVSPRSPNQARYVRAIETHDLVFGIGPAGTGKTYLAVAMAISRLLHKQVQRIVLARPAVEAGEKLGFLPGDLAEKINPYLRPLYDALYHMLSTDKALKLVERGVIEVAPLAFMRGRTLSDSFIILDEAQNSTSEQMKMFLTRIGLNSQAVVTGDVTQIDLPRGQRSGLVEATEILEGVSGIAFCGFTQQDVVRHPLVRSIIDAYQSGGRHPKRD